MPNEFFIELNIRTINGFERYGCFDLGTDRGFALDLFSRLEGRPIAGDYGVLHLDLVEKQAGLPINIQVRACTVEELCRNTRLITREIFKNINLNELPPGR